MITHPDIILEEEQALIDRGLEAFLEDPLYLEKVLWSARRYKVQSETTRQRRLGKKRDVAHTPS
jgi:hypothetical protein